MNVAINRVVMYAKHVDKMVAFYEKYFAFTADVAEGDRIVELTPADGGMTLLIHQAGKGMKEGQACVKLVFDVEDVPQFHERCAQNGLKLGTIHQADGYVYANGKDPSKNSIQISSRAFRPILSSDGE